MVIGDESFKIAWRIQNAWSNCLTGDCQENNIKFISQQFICNYRKNIYGNDQHKQYCKKRWLYGK